MVIFKVPDLKMGKSLKVAKDVIDTGRILRIALFKAQTEADPLPRANKYPESYQNAL